MGLQTQVLFIYKYLYIKKVKIIINEFQYRNILLEESQGMSSFLRSLTLRFKELKPYTTNLKDAIDKSGCEKIEFGGFTIKALGLSLPSGVLMNTTLLNYNLPMVIFVIFHEIAHQYQYKKYGKDVSFKIFKNDMNIMDGIKILKQIESTADRFAAKKSLEFSKLGLFPENKIVKDIGYSNYSDAMFIQYIQMMRKKIEESNVTSTEEISTMFYNWIKEVL